MKKPLMVIVNPAAGKGAYKKKFAEVLKVFSDGGYAPSLFFTAKSGDATELAAEKGADAELLVCIGGDGTLSEVVAGLMRLNTRPLVGYIPLGTANDVARSLGLPKRDPVKAARRIVRGVSMPFDVGKRSGGYFNYVAAFGAFTEVSYGTPQKFKRRLGEAAYLIGAAKSLRSLKSRRVHIEYDGGVIDGDFLYGSVSNSYSVAGLIDLPKDAIELGDGAHELILLEKPRHMAQLAPLAAKVLHGNFDSEYIKILHTTHAVFTFDAPESFTFDGEDGGSHEHIEFSTCPQAIRIIH